MRFAVLVIWKDGTEEWVLEGSEVARFSSRRRAQEQADFMKIGMEDEVQSINIVQAPKATR